MKRTGPTNVYLKQLIEKLKRISHEKNIPFWSTIAYHLEKPRRKRVEVNLSRIERYAREGETVIVPGVVLAAGNLTKPVKIVAWKFSESARKKIEKAKGKCMSIEELLKENPKGSNVKIIC